MSKNPLDTVANQKITALEKEKQYRSIFENTGTGTIISEADMTISLANGEFSRMTGYRRCDIEGKMKWTQIVAFARDREKMIQYHLMRRKKPVIQAPRNYEFTLRGRNNDKKNILARVDVIPGTDKSVGSFIDITPMVRAQQEIRESESRLRGILEAFEGFIYICDKNHRVTYVNKNLETIAGGAGSVLPCHKKIFNMENPCPWCTLDAVFQGKSVKQEVQCSRTNRWYYAVSTPILGSDRQVIKQQTVLIDIHERKQTETQIKAKKDRLHKENIKLKAALGENSAFCGIVGNSRAMQKIYELILRASMTDVNVIVYGESGTGKELAAKAVHDMSDRSQSPFVPVNCGAIPPNLMESEFFGVKKGAFTGASTDRPGLLDLAQKGTLFLDELGELDLNFQVKLLRVLEGSGYMAVGGRTVKQTNIRIVAATNRDLNTLVKKGLMREDFFYRIHILPIYLPPLRERKEDLPLLVSHFLEKHQAKYRSLQPHVLTSLTTHDWPGNVRELENTLHRFISLDNLDFLNTARDEHSPGCPEPFSGQETMGLKPAVDRFEKAHILRVLDANHWNRRATAKTLSIGRKTLYLKMRQLGITQSGQS